MKSEQEVRTQMAVIESQLVKIRSHIVELNYKINSVQMGLTENNVLVKNREFHLNVERRLVAELSGYHWVLGMEAIQ